MLMALPRRDVVARRTGCGQALLIKLLLTLVTRSSGLVVGSRGSSKRTGLAPPVVTWPVGASPSAAPAVFAPGPVSYLRHGVDWQQDSCGSRFRQSPISLDTSLEELPRDFFKYRYAPITAPVQLLAGNGTLSLNLEDLALGGVEYRQVPYRLVRMDVRGPAEHLQRGERSPLELQLVHRQANVYSGGNYLIVSVLVLCEHVPPPPAVAPVQYAPPSSGEADFDANLQHLVESQPPQVDGAATELASISEQTPFDLASLMQSSEVPLKERGRYVAYPGSLTAPPCEERVTWLVRRSTLLASDSQVRALADALYTLTGNAGNFRAVMPLNQRVLSIIGAKEDPSLAVVGGNGSSWQRRFLPLGPNPRTDDELRALRFAEATKQKVGQVVAYTDNFVNRLSAAHAAAAYKLGVGSSANFESPAEPSTTMTTTELLKPLRDAMSGAAAMLRAEATAQASVAVSLAPDSVPNITAAEIPPPEGLRPTEGLANVSAFAATTPTVLRRPVLL